MELLPITEKDQPVMLQLLTDERIKQTFLLPDFDKKEDAIPLFQRLCRLSLEDTRFVRGIFAEKKLVGFLNDVETRNGTIELGYVIHPDFWNRGYATAALKDAISQLFSLGYREVIAGAFEENKASLRVMEKAGMEPLEKTEIIEYRGRSHACAYRRIRAVTLCTPSLPEMAFRKEMLADPETMAYNRRWGGTVDFREDRWEEWYRRWVGSDDTNRFYRYLYSRRLHTFVGEAAYHREEETNRWLCDVIVQAKYRRQGFGSGALELLCEAAAKNGIRELYDEIALDNPSVTVFLKQGFEETARTDTAIVLKKRLG